MINTTKDVNDGIYSCDDIQISKEEWLILLADKNVFTDKSASALFLLYNQPEHKGSCYDIGKKYNMHSQCYNAIITALAKRVCKKLQIYITGTDGELTYWVVLMSYGKDIKNENGLHFEWCLRPELVEALSYLEHITANHNEINEDDSELESYVFVPDSKTEGKRKLIFSTHYERNLVNRNNAIKYHGTKCMVCGFDFEETYGELGKGYIQVHHLIPISTLEQEVEIDPKTDLVCICANCHCMIHRKHYSILSVDELKKLLKNSHLN